MIISRTPLRMSFTGGGSDIPAFYKHHGGAVISTAIDKYVYVTVNRKFDMGIRIAYSKNEEADHIHQIEHPLVRAAVEYLDISGGIEITSIADIPSKGTGLGSSSSFTVGLLHALNAYLGRYVSSVQLASDGCHVELDLCGEPIGKQDQYAAAFGGLNLIEFHEDDSVKVSPIIFKKETSKSLEENLIIFYTGLTRNASALLKYQTEQILNRKEKQASQRQMVILTYELRDELQKNNLEAFGEILHEHWLLKKSLSNEISSPEIDNYYSKARTVGAIGGKILGAGAGGFLMFYAPKERHEEIKLALSTLRHIPIGFEPLGSRIIFYHE